MTDTKHKTTQTASHAVGNMTAFIFEQVDGLPDRAFVDADGKYSVVIIRTDEGIIVDVYPKDWDAPIDSISIHDHDVAEGETA